PRQRGRDERARPSLPHDLTKLTAEQVEWCVVYHAALPLAEIRRRQELTDQQIRMAWQQRNDFALNNLRVREEILRRAAAMKAAGRRQSGSRKKKPVPSRWPR
ncbi:MAG: hypothetical protein ACREHD_30365, partial [Pirellulales bacterium]